MMMKEIEWGEERGELLVEGGNAIPVGHGFRRKGKKEMSRINL